MWTTMRVLRFAVGLASLVLTLLLAGLLLVASAVPLVTGWPRVVLTSGSMSPGLMPGDVVIADPRLEHPVPKGTVLVFQDPTREGLVTHRVIEAHLDGTYRTKGDANEDPDSVPVTPEMVVGKGRVMVPVVGTPAMWMQQGKRDLALLSLAVVALLMWLCRYGIQDRYDPWLTPQPEPLGRPRRLLRLAVPVLVLGSLVTVMPVVARAAYVDTAVNATNYLARPAAGLTRYLKTNASGNTTSSAVLPLSASAPTLTTLFNYDTNRDSYPGLYLAKGNGISETDANKVQRWNFTVSSATTLSGTASVQLWSAIKDFNSTKRGEVQVGLFDCDGSGSSCVQLGAQTLNPSGAWSGGSNTWVSRTWNLGAVSRTVAAGRVLQVRVAPLGNSEDDMWFAYDTTSYPAKLTVG